MLEYEKREGLVNEKTAAKQERLIRGYAKTHSIKLKKVKVWPRPSELTEPARYLLRLNGALTGLSAAVRKRLERFVKAEEEKVKRHIRLTTVVLEHGRATRQANASDVADKVYELTDKLAKSGPKMTRKKFPAELFRVYKIELGLRQIDRILKKRPAR